MATEDRFKQAVVMALAKRAANRCSNPDCRAITSGPSSSPEGSVNIGQAAHIYGANPGSARYDAAMLASERSAISIALWLCGNCHKKVDDDPARFPAGLLFEWRKIHEALIAEQLGQTSAEARQRYESRHIESLGSVSYLAERLILDKDDYWEYLLTAEVLRTETAPFLRRWNALKQGLYMKPTVRVPKQDSLLWVSDRSYEIELLVDALAKLSGDELNRAWGASGVPGDEAEIIATCRLYGEFCARALALEEEVRFTRGYEEFEYVRQLFPGIAGGFMEHVHKIPTFLEKTISGAPTPGVYELVLTMALPDGWVEKVKAAISRAARTL